MKIYLNLRPMILTAAILSSAMLSVVNADSAKLNDKAIFSIYDQVNGFDVETATLGAVKGNTEDVRALAAMVLRDHSGVIQMTRGLASQLNISYQVNSNNDSARQHSSTLNRLKTKKGKAFDRAYLQHEIKFHRSAIDVVNNTLLPAIKNQELKKLVKAVLPGFEHHLAETLSISEKLGVNKSGEK